MKRTLPVLLLALAGLAACKDGTGSSSSIAELVIEPSTYFLSQGDTVRLTAVGIDDEQKFVGITGASYKSTNPSVASVTGDGKVTALAVGTAQIVGKAEGRADTATINVTATANIRTFNVDAVGITGCDQPVYHSARQVASAAHVLIYEDTNNPAGGFTAAEYQAIANEFDATIYPTDLANFGTPTDLDGNGKVIILYTRAVNELTPPGAGFVYGGFFYPRDAFPRTPTTELDACPTSNVSEMFYLLSADPSGSINGHVRSKDYVRENTLTTTAHELQHLINYSRRLYVNKVREDEEVWLDEGLSHIAEELAYYAESGHAPRQNIDRAQIFASTQQTSLFEEFQGQNLGRYETYLRDPSSNSPYANNDELETRGATWNFLRYAADRRNGNDAALWFALANGTSVGLNNLSNALGTDPVALARDWAVSVYTDDAGIPVAPQFTQPSWNFRDIFRATTGGVYPLRVLALANGANNVSVKSGSAAYYKFAVAPGQQADVRVAQSGTTVGGACTVLNLAVGQVQQVVMSGGVALCPTGGAAGAEYVVIPFYGSATQDATISLTLTAQSVGTAVGPPNPSKSLDLSASGVSPFPLDRMSLPQGGGLDLQMRLRGQRLMQTLAGGRKGPRMAVNGVDGPGGVTVNIVRTK
ncbi:hypothetical protein [Longimicrobium sp.]|uniref:hypothetical protein n=1 Tax=Longimicrobium sp. TaxID=2029185 RepID=UPI002BB53A92|nr:hypothetical protein [Longimicrobium sp.]HSU12453.1 hypothetical protein [Longimicrobium sp.]